MPKMMQRNNPVKHRIKRYGFRDRRGKKQKNIKFRVQTKKDGQWLTVFDEIHDEDVALFLLGQLYGFTI